MGGGGGSAGSVEFPEYLQDTHGNYLAGSGVGSDGSYGGSPSYPTFTVTQLLDDAYADNPYNNLSISQPSNVLAPSDAQFDDFYAKVNNYEDDRIDDLSTEVFNHLIRVGDWTGELEDIDPSVCLPRADQARLDLSTPALDVSLSVITGAYNEITSLVPSVSTPAWTSAMEDATPQLDSDLRTADINQLFVDAASNAEVVVDDAIRIAKDVSTSPAVTDLINNFASRRQDTYQRQVGSFNAQMADGMATNSSAYMFGLALLKNQQHREEAQFDREIVYETYNNAIQAHIEAHSDTLSTQAQAELANAEQYNNFLLEAVRAILEIRLQEWNQEEDIGEEQLLNLFNTVFQAQLQAAIQTTELDLDLTRLNSEIQRFNSQQKLRAEQLGVETQRINKEAREERFREGMRLVIQMLGNRVQFEKAAADLKTEQKRIELVGRQETEGFEADVADREARWGFTIMEEAASILAAPQGMGRRLPEKESKASSALGGALQGAGAGASVGTAIAPGIGTAIGAGAGAVLGGLGGLL